MGEPCSTMGRGRPARLAIIIRSFPDGHALGPWLQLQPVNLPTWMKGGNDFPQTASALPCCWRLRETVQRYNSCRTQAKSECSLPTDSRCALSRRFWSCRSFLPLRRDRTALSNLRTLLDDASSECQHVRFGEDTGEK